jgi:hypothetical protein
VVYISIWIILASCLNEICWSVYGILQPIDKFVLVNIIIYKFYNIIVMYFILIHEIYVRERLNDLKFMSGYIQISLRGMLNDQFGTF